jgi:hypothetical protein
VPGIGRPEHGLQIPGHRLPLAASRDRLAGISMDTLFLGDERRGTGQITAA